jgi:hypothetical protein
MDLFPNIGVFGNQELVIDYRGRTRWEPSNCYECGVYLDFWNNYNYRICPSCWNVINNQLYLKLENEIGDLCYLVYSFIQVPPQH